MKIVYVGGEAQIVEKKSRFIATVRPAASEEDALNFIAEMKKKYRDASHNCSAFVIGEQSRLQRCSDDGEPQGTAGRPMLDVLTGEDLHNTAVVVTRYFGGTLLGTGGLIRAYEKAVQEGLKASVIAEERTGIPLTIRTDYSGIGKIRYLLSSRDLPTLDTDYTDSVSVTVLVSAGEENSLRDAVTEATSGKAGFTSGKPVSYVLTDGSPVLLQTGRE